MSVQAEDLIRIAQRVLAIVGIIDYAELKLTYALKTNGKWKVSFAYDAYVRNAINKIVSFTVDEKSGEIEGVWLDRSWK